MALTYNEAWVQLNGYYRDLYGEAGYDKIQDIIKTQFNGDTGAFFDSNYVATTSDSTGLVNGYTFRNTANIGNVTSTEVGAVANSNTVGATAGSGSIAGDTIIDVTYTEVEGIAVNTGARSLATGAKSALNFTRTEIAPAVAAVGAGIALGKTVDKLLYNANPDFWDSKGMSTLNPDTWNSITSDYDGVAGKLFNMIFGINPDTGEGQAYIDENALAYVTAYMQSKGLFSSSDVTLSVDNIDKTKLNYPNFNYETIPFGSPYMEGYVSNRHTKVVNVSTQDVYGNIPIQTTNGKYRTSGYSFYSKNNTYTIEGKINDRIDVNISTNDGIINAWTQGAFSSTDFPTFIGATYFIPEEYNAGDFYSDIAYIFNTNGLKGSSIEGVENQPSSTQYNTLSVTDPSDISQTLNNLKQQYPELWNNAIVNSTVDPQTNVQTDHVYVPINLPNGVTNPLTDTQPTSDTNAQSGVQGQSGINPQTEPNEATKALLDWLLPTITPTKTDNPTDTGTGETPAVVTPTGTASALWTVYNPSQAQINQFGSWLWSSDFVDQLKKLFNDPMSAIIGLHKVFCVPITGGTQNIKVGYLDSGVPSAVVTNQYVTINCGSVNLPEYFGNVLDYTQTHIQCYLPFIGIVPISTNEVMRSTISIKYHVDVLTGACLAEINVQRDGNTANLYTYSGNASVQYPLSSGSYMGIVSSALSIAGSIGSALLTGGATLPMVAGATVNAVANAHTNVQHSGSLSGNAGAMGGKIPYLIISRPQTHIASNYQHFFGRPENKYVTLSQCSGFTRCSAVHVENIVNATDEEKREIERLLREGVIL